VITRARLFSYMLIGILLVSVSALSMPALAADSDGMGVRNAGGSIAYANGHGQGNLIFFDLNETSGELSDFGLNTPEGEKALLHSLSIEGFVPEGITTMGSLARMTGENGTVVLHDNPTGMVHVFMRDACEITIVLAGNFTVTDRKEVGNATNISYQLVLSDGRFEGAISSDAPFEVSEDGTAVTCSARDLMVKFMPQLALHPDWREALVMEAIQDGRVAMELALFSEGAEGSYDVVSYNEGLNAQVQKVERGRLQFVIGGENHQGAVLLVHTDKATLDNGNGLRVTMNGDRMALVEEPVELLFEQKQQASYGVIDEGENQLMVVYLPVNSVGMITVESVDPLSDLLSPSGLAMVIGAIGIVVLAAVAVFRRF